MKIAVVTGTSTGIGFATSLHLARHGYRVFAGMRNLAKARAAPHGGGGPARRGHRARRHLGRVHR